MKFPRIVLLSICAVLGAGAGHFFHARPGARSGRDFAPHPSPIATPTPDDPVASALSLALSLHSAQDVAAMQPRLEKFDAAQIAQLLARVHSVPAHLRAELLPLLLRWWMKHDLPAAMAWLPQFDRQTEPSESLDEDTDLISAWIDSAPQAALAHARAHPGTPLSWRILGQLSLSGEKIPRDLLTAILELPRSFQRTSMQASFLNHWASRDPEGAFVAAQEIPAGPDRDAALTRVLGKIASERPEQGLVMARESRMGDDAFREVFDWATRDHPDTVAEWLARQDPAFLANHAPSLVSIWLEKDPSKAFAWAWAHGISALEGGDLPNVASSLLINGLRADYDATLAWVKSLPVGQEREKYLRVILRQPGPFEAHSAIYPLLSGSVAPIEAYHLASRWDSEEFPKVLKWISTLPSGPARQQAWAGIASPLAHYPDLLESLDLDGKLAKGILSPADRDALVAALILQPDLDLSDPRWAEPLDRIAELRDFALRRQTFDDALSLAAQNPERRAPARAWLEKAPVPAEWKQRWCEALR